MATIKDVAKKAGVSVATVSRVLNDSGYYDPETGQKVRQAVSSLGYRRNVHWTRLKRKSSETVCFLLSNRESMNSMQMRVLMASEKAFHAAGMDVVFARHSYSISERSEAAILPRMLLQEGIADGVVIAGLNHANLLDALEQRAIPHVILANTFTGPSERLLNDSVVYDEETAAYEAALYLMRLGHRRIAFVGNENLPWFERRRKGYRRALKQQKLTEIAITGNWQLRNIEYGQLAAAELLRRAEPPTAIFGANDAIAAGIWKELMKRGVRIPRQMSLIGFGDREEFSILEPELTSVSVFPEQLGAMLASMLLQKLAGPSLNVPSIMLPCKIVERGSCAAPAAKLAVVG